LEIFVNIGPFAGIAKCVKLYVGNLLPI